MLINNVCRVPVDQLGVVCTNYYTVCHSLLQEKYIDSMVIQYSERTKKSA